MKSISKHYSTGTILERQNAKGVIMLQECNVTFRKECRSQSYRIATSQRTGNMGSSHIVCHNCMKYIDIISWHVMLEYVPTKHTLTKPLAAPKYRKYQELLGTLGQRWPNARSVRLLEIGVLEIRIVDSSRKNSDDLGRLHEIFELLSTFRPIRKRK